MKKIQIIKGKRTGFSKLYPVGRDGKPNLVMNVPVDEIVELRKNVHYELIFTVRPSNHKQFYNVTIDPIVGELLKVKLHRKTNDISGSVHIDVILIEHDKSYEEVQAELKKLEKEYKSAMAIFGAKDEEQSVEELSREVADLSSRRYKRP